MTAASISIASAQTVRGRVIEEGSAQPVVGAFVILVDASGNDRDAVPTDPRGRFELTAPSPGPYHLRVDRIGYRTTHSPEIQLTGRDALEYDLRVRVEAIQLAAIALESERVCDTPLAEAARISGVWEEARKALFATAWTEAQQPYRLTVRHFERRRDARNDRIDDEISFIREGINSSSPFISLPPAELAAGGYTRDETAVVRYFAPDADVLLSDDFAETHCFRLRPADAAHPGMIGLAFEPQEGREVVDIEGALWIDEKTAELKLLEYGYTGVSRRVDESEAGGHVAFERLPSGAWIVSDWQINAPAIRRAAQTWQERALGGALRTRSSQLRDAVIAVLETGGSVEQVHDLDGTLLRGSETAVITGAIHDSLSDGPLAGATVSIRNTTYRTVSDSLGTFRFADIPGGPYTVVVDHPRLDSLAVALREEIRVDPGSSERVHLGIPSLTTLLAETCATEKDAAAVVGLVHDATSGAPLATARVHLAWRDETGRQARREVTSDGTGHYVACGVPAGRTVVARATFPGRSARDVFVLPSADRPMRHDLPLEAAGLESVVAIDDRGSGPVAVGGWVVDDVSGEPLAGAQVVLAGTGAGAVADEGGRFLIGGVEPGPHVVEVQFLGYTTARASIELGEEQWLSLAVRMVREPIAADPIAVAAQTGGAPRGEGVTIRRMTARDIEAHPAMNLVELMAMTVPGVESGFDASLGCPVPILRAPPGMVRETRPRGRTSTGTARNLSPLIVVEGTPLSNPCELAIINPSDIQQIEIVTALAGTSQYGWRGVNGVIRIEIKKSVRKPPAVAAEEELPPTDTTRPGGEEPARRVQ